GTQAMAQRLGVSNTTVRTHSQRLLTKLGVHSRLQAASFAVRYSLLDRLPMAEGAAPYARWS
ncbi:MAG: response regulator transcription factor, partial [Pseudonocardiaceae bacterium]